MPSAPVPSVKLGVTVKPPTTALSTITVKVIESPSVADASPTVRVAVSSLVIVPVAASVADMVITVSEMVRPTVKVSAASTTSSSVVATVKVFVSPAVPAKTSPAVFSV